MPILPAFSQVGLNDVAPGKDLVSLTTPRWKYVLDRKNGVKELYERHKDPGETHNLAIGPLIDTADLDGIVSRFLSASVRRGGPVPHMELDPELILRLRSLGYLGDSAGPEPPR